jgi:hypothetical protein
MAGIPVFIRSGLATFGAPRSAIKTACGWFGGDTQMTASSFPPTLEAARHPPRRRRARGAAAKPALRPKSYFNSLDEKSR